MVMDIAVNANWFFGLAVALFAIGMYGLMTQQSGIRLLMCVELMLNAANINFVAFASLWGEAEGLVYALFSISIAAAEAAVGLAILVNVFRVRASINADEVNTLRW